MKLIYFILLLSLISPASAGVTVDIGAGMVSKGIDMFFDSAATMLGNHTTNTNMGMWFNPFDVGIVRKTNKSMALYAFTIFALIVFGSLIYLCCQSMNPPTARGIEFILNNGSAFDLKSFSTRCGRILVGWIVTPTIILLLLIQQQVLYRSLCLQLP